MNEKDLTPELLKEAAKDLNQLDITPKINVEASHGIKGDILSYVEAVEPEDVIAPRTLEVLTAMGVERVEGKFIPRPPVKSKEKAEPALRAKSKGKDEGSEPSNELQVIFKKPSLPADWDYDESVKKVKGFVFKWRNMTEEIITELWIAREKLRHPGKRVDLNLSRKMDRSMPTWKQYCADIGSQINVVDNWLNRWVEKKRGLLGQKIDRLPEVFKCPKCGYEWTKEKKRDVKKGRKR